MTRPTYRLLALSLTCLALGAAGCGDSEDGTTPGTDTSATSPLATELLAAHNQARANAKPTPQPALPPLTWSTDAAKVAEKWAAECRFEHNKDRGNYGENIAAAAPAGSRTNTQVVQDWVSEGANYTYADNSCASGKVCGHYTQVVWRNTTQVGCATVTCTKNSPFGAQYPQWQLWVCDYAPPGNYVGQKPY
ncbi:CAP domain-containing protein [Vitiosangium sp. GDMCC 1.1324]|uniref:CAP domain-containing protein n=1 Tax=Vitiosangium sp. (strain GDMCC 1.1324) TaxID=2138576 RepID=UPI000D3678D4|nr:CAP domain-containing protein [Vitiosangium sp. GDMCC 1.1324]PTL83335.1 serine protease [Vitiosangium sp. GDMCC 1.1324]